MIYLDHAATTPLDPRVLEVMQPHLANSWGNPSSPHAKGREARAAIDAARQTTADLMGVDNHEVIFVSSGSEGNSLALFGITEGKKPGNIIISSIEHSCSLKAADKLEQHGWTVTRLPVDEYGMVSVDDIAKAITDDTAIVSIHWANNEVGTIQPIDDIAKLCKERSVPFHCDAVQGIGLLPSPNPSPDLMTIAAHKFYGPKGIGALIVKDAIELKPLIMGGGQEFDLRAGTEDTPAIVGMTKALELAIADIPSKVDEIQSLRDQFVEDVLKINGTSLNGHPNKRLPNFANIHFAGQSAEQLVIQLDMQGICVSSGAACTTGATEPSHVLQAMGQSSKESMENVRFSLGRHTTKEELETTVQKLQKIVNTK